MRGDGLPTLAAIYIKGVKHLTYVADYYAIKVYYLFLLKYHIVDKFILCTNVQLNPEMEKTVIGPLVCTFKYAKMTLIGVELEIGRIDHVCTLGIMPT